MLIFFLCIVAINRPDITDTEMETVMDTIVDSLFCFFVTLGKLLNICSFKETNYFTTHFDMLHTLIVFLKERVLLAGLELTRDLPVSASQVLRD